MSAIYECHGCGAQFQEGEVKPVFQCSLTHREPYRGSGEFIDCPKCGKFEGVKDLRPPPPPDPHYNGPIIREVAHPVLIDSKMIEVAHPVETMFHGPEKEERAPRRGISSATASILGMVAALAPDTPLRSDRIAGQEECTNCGRVEEHSPECRPPRGYRKVT